MVLANPTYEACVPQIATSKLHCLANQCQNSKKANWGMPKP